MSQAAPSFSSFPDLEKPTSHASSSRQPAPTFGSFPADVAPSTKDDRHKDRYGERRDRDRDSTRRRTEEDASRRRRRSRSDDEREDRRRERRRDEKRARERDDEERARKEDRRRREREKADKLVRNELDRMDRRELERRVDKVDIRPDLYEVNDGGAWYESVTNARPRAGYQEPYDPVSLRLTWSDASDFQMAPSTSYKDTAGDRDAARYNASSSHAAPKYYRDGGEGAAARVRFKADL